jgi:predicted DNA-binding transcriptional regulator AlpA
METEQTRPNLARLIDSEQLSAKLEMRLGEVVSHAEQHGFPQPVGNYRSRLLWDETDVDTWLDQGQP